MSNLETVLRDLVRQEVDKALAAKPKEPVAADYLSPVVAGAVAGVAPATIRRWIREGRLIAHRAGRVVRVRRVDLEGLLSVENHGLKRPSGRKLSPEDLALQKFRCMRGSGG